MTRLVDRLGRTGFAAASSVIWALPMAAWAGSSDLSPVDRTSYPGIALAIGTVMLAIWLAMVTQLRRVAVTPRPRRFDIGQMSTIEKRWTLAVIALFTGIVAWLNAAATVDWRPLISALAKGSIAAIAFAAVLLVILAALIAGLRAAWQRETRAYRERLASLSNMG